MDALVKHAIVWFLTLMIKASIIIRTYNGAKTLGKALESAFSQDFPEDQFEVVVVDDGSTDETSEVLAQFQSKKNFRVHQQTNQGGIVAANKGFELSQGDYVTLLDSDDIFAHDLLKKLTAFLDENPEVDFVYPDYYEVRGEEKKLVSPKSAFESLSVGTLFRREKFKEAGYFKVGVTFAEYDLFLRTLKDWKGVHFPEPLFYYMRHDSSSTANPNFVREGVDQLKSLHPEKLDFIRKIRSY
ncbi:MAG: glycosyltransferase [Patescibacteria group bacterium]